MTSRDTSGNREFVEKYPFLAIKDGDTGQLSKKKTGLGP